MVDQEELNYNQNSNQRQYSPRMLNDSKLNHQYITSPVLKHNIDLKSINRIMLKFKNDYMQNDEIQMQSTSNSTLSTISTTSTSSQCNILTYPKSKHFFHSENNINKNNQLKSNYHSPLPANSHTTTTTNEKDKVNPLWLITRQTKFLSAIIVTLIIIILGLLIFDRRSSDYQESYDNNNNNNRPAMLYQNKFHQRTNNNNNQAEQLTGKLMMASSGDNHFGVYHPSGLDHFDNDNSNDQDSSNDHHNNSFFEKSSRQDNNRDQEFVNNQVLPDNNETGDDNDDFDRPTNGPHKGNKNNNSRFKQKIETNPESICVTPGCVRAAAQIMNNMDNRTKPCDDFYQFACGRWIETQLIPDEKTSLSVFSQNTADLNIKLRALIERKASDDDPPIVGQMRNLYGSCMNISDIESRGDKPLLDVLQDLGGWPVLMQPSPSSSPLRRSLLSNLDSSSQQGTTSSRSNQQQYNWLETLIKFRQRGFSHDMMIDLSVVPDVRNSRRYIIELDQSSLGLPDRSYYFKGLNDTTVAAYYSLMVESAVMLGAPSMEARKQMLEAFEFERSLAKISVPREQRRNVTRLYNKMIASDLYKLAPNINWQRYLSLLLRDDQLDLDKDEVIVKVPTFIKSIDTLLTQTDPKVIHNYMLWRIVRHSMNGLSRKWRELAHSYSTVITGRLIEEPRWEQCLSSLEGTLGAALSALYVKNHFNQQSKQTALQMVNYIRGEFLKILDEIDWMDEETREEAKLKAKSISPYIGYPDELLQDNLVEELYNGLIMSKTNYYQNVRNLRIWSTNYAFNQLRKPNKRGDWKKHARAAVVNAYYSSLENSIEFPAGILQGAFFDAERPNYMNFGAIGYVIGHEITHGFDDRGRQFDRDGNDRNWWKPKTDARFKERAQCIIEQYGNYTVAENGLRVNGLNTQGENIADNGGIKEAFRAYKRWTKDNGREQKLPGLNYTPDQLFWISAANIWCGKFRPEVLKLRVNSGVHSPARFRIIGPLSNSPDFSKSFNCPTGSPMNPKKKCSVW